MSAQEPDDKTLLSLSDRETVLEAARRYPQKAQCEVAQEECGDLVSTLSRYYRRRVGADQVIEGIADALNMLNQLAVVFGEKEVADMQARKLAVLRERFLRRPIA